MTIHGELGTCFEKLDGKVRWELCLQLRGLLTGYEKLCHSEDSKWIAEIDCANLHSLRFSGLGWITWVT